ncbi:MAG: hypothetical protein ACK5LY_06270 [Lachnospirales bacterium]
MATLQNSRNGTLQKKKTNFHTFDKRLKWQKDAISTIFVKSHKAVIF